MWALARSQKPACPCGFDETTCMACSDFKLQAQKTVSLDGKGRVNLNQSEMSRISNAFFKAAKSKEEREAAESGPCSSWLTRSIATVSALTLSSAMIAVSVGPAIKSIPTPFENRSAACFTQW